MSSDGMQHCEPAVWSAVRYALGHQVYSGVVYDAQGATNVVLDGVYHSMSSVGSFSEPTGHVWYGSDSVVDHWLCHVVPNLTLA